MNITDIFIEGLLELSNNEIPDRIVHQIKRCLLDYIGVTIAGAISQKEKLERYVKENSVNDDCPVIGLGIKADFNTASVINGYSSHVLELDDGHRYAMLHLGAPIISALLTLAERKKINLEQFFKGIVIGYESTIRLARSIQPSHKNRGYHATGTCGTIGIAFALSVALGYSIEQVKNTISAAATSASGLLAVIDDTSELKPYNVSSAILNGIAAAHFGKIGFIGPQDILGGKRGFIKTLAEEYDESPLYAKADKFYEIERIYVKPYAACRHAHSAIEAALLINKNEKIKIEDIDAIVVKTYKLAVLGHDHIDIESVSSAKMSIPFGVATALILNDAGINAYTEKTINRADISDLSRKVRVLEDKTLTSLSPDKRGALIKIYTKSGLIFEELVEHPLGEPENNINDEDLEKKFSNLMKHSGKSKDEIIKLSKAIWCIEECFDDLLALI